MCFLFFIIHYYTLYCNTLYIIRLYTLLINVHIIYVRIIQELHNNVFNIVLRAYQLHSIRMHFTTVFLKFIVFLKMQLQRILVYFTETFK